MKLPFAFNFGEGYVTALEETTEASPLYHHAALLTVVGAAIGRRLYVEYGHRLYPNLYTCLIGDAGESRKSTSIGLALRLIAELAGRAQPGYLNPPVDTVPTMRGLSTVEGLLQHLQGSQGKALVVLEELASLMMKAKKQDFSAALLPKLAELYDNPDKVGVYTRKAPLVVDRPFVAILAATTPAWLEAVMDSGDVLSGLASRFMFIVGKPSGDISFPETPHLGEIQEKLMKRLGRLGEAQEMKLDGDCVEMWDAWYKEWRGGQKEKDETARALAVRIPETVLKVAMIMQFLDAGTDLLEWESLQSAIQFVENVQESLKDVRPLLSGLDEKVLRKVEMAGAAGVGRGRIHEQIGGKVKSGELRQSIDNLVSLRRLGVNKEGRYVLAQRAA